MKQLSVFFYLKKGKSNEAGLAPIYGKITYLDSKSTFSTGIYIDPSDWIKTKYLTKPITQEEDKLRREINSIREKIMHSEEKLRILSQPISASILKDSLFPKNTATVSQAKPKITILKVFDELLKEKELLVNAGMRSDSTLTKYNTVQMHLCAYLAEELKRKDIPLDELNYSFIKGFYLYLISSTNSKMAICNNTSQKYVQAMYGAIRHALKMDYIVTDPFKRYEYEWEDVDTVYLTREELDRIEFKVFSSDRLNVVKDIFLFCCYTGYAPCDLEHITKDKIELRSDGERWFNMRRNKTGTKSDVMLLPPVDKLIEKYKSDPLCRAKNMVVPYRSNQTMNEYLKEIATLCNISKNLTHYAARHTYATTIMLGNGASKAVTGKTMGHLRPQQTEHYAKVVDQQVSSEMKMVKAKLMEQDKASKN